MLSTIRKRLARPLRRKRTSQQLHYAALGDDTCDYSLNKFGLAKIPGLIVHHDTFLDLEETESLDDMLRVLDRLDGLRKRSSSSSSYDSSKEEESFSLSDKSFDTVETEEDTSESSSDRCESSPRRPQSQTEHSESQDQEVAVEAPPSPRAIRWADECSTEGHQELVRVYSLPQEQEANVRIVVLLLHPIDRKFEFVHCEYATDSILKVKDILRQLPYLASNPLLRQLRYTALCCQDQELLNALPITDYDISAADVLVAVPSKCKPRDVMYQASGLLANKVLRRAVRKAKLSGRALQRLQSSAELEAQRSQSPDQVETDYEDEEMKRDQTKQRSVESNDASQRRPLSAPQPAFESDVESEAEEQRDEHESDNESDEADDGFDAFGLASNTTSPLQPLAEMQRECQELEKSNCDVELESLEEDLFVPDLDSSNDVVQASLPQEQQTVSSLNDASSFFSSEDLTVTDVTETLQTLIAQVDSLDEEEDDDDDDDEEEEERGASPVSNYRDLLTKSAAAISLAAVVLGTASGR